MLVLGLACIFAFSSGSRVKTQEACVYVQFARLPPLNQTQVSIVTVRMAPFSFEYVADLIFGNTSISSKLTQHFLFVSSQPFDQNRSERRSSSSRGGVALKKRRPEEGVPETQVSGHEAVRDMCVCRKAGLDKRDAVQRQQPTTIFSTCASHLLRR